MTQTRLISIAETLTNICVGVVVNFTLAQVLFPAFGIHVTVSANLKVTAILTVAAILRGYAIRRVYNR